MVTPAAPGASRGAGQVARDIAPTVQSARKHKKHHKCKTHKKHGKHHKCKKKHKKHKKHKKKHKSAARWIRLPGSVLAHTDDALLTRDSVLSPSGGGDVPPVYHVLGTRAGPDVIIDGRSGVPPGTTAEGDEQLLTPPTSGHPLGLAVLLLRVTTPASGINPEQAHGYFSVFDAATGTHLFTSAPFDANSDALGSQPVAYVDGSVRLAGCEYTTVNAAGNISHTPFPGHGTDPGTESCRASDVVDGRILIAGYDQAPDACPTVYVSDVISQGTLSQSPCLETVDNPSAWLFNGGAYGVWNTPTIFAASNSSPLTAPNEFDISEGHAAFLGGVRSDLVLVYPDHGEDGDGPSYFVSTSSWQPVFTAAPDQVFTPYGIADDYAWVDGPAGRVVVDARTGSEVAADWRVYPEAGGTGWTLASENDVCCDREYLLRSNGTLLQSLSNVPSS